MHTATITRDANGVPTGLGNIASATLIGGMVSGLTQCVDSDAVVIPDSLLEKLAVEGTKVAVGGLIQKKVVEGELGIPFMKRY